MRRTFLIVAAVLFVAAPAAAEDRNDASTKVRERSIEALKFERAEKVEAPRLENRSIQGKVNKLRNAVRSLVASHNELVTSHNGLVAAHNDLVAKHNTVATTIATCLSTKARLTQYGDPFGTYGYLFDNDQFTGGEFNTSAVDFTEVGDAADIQAVTTPC